LSASENTDGRIWKDRLSHKFRDLEKWLNVKINPISSQFEFVT
jgi:hypothetical protein